MGFAVNQPSQPSPGLNALVTQTDAIEPSLASLLSLAAAEGADVASVQSATANLLIALQAFQAENATGLNAISQTEADQLLKLIQIYGSATNSESALGLIDTRVAALQSQLGTTSDLATLLVEIRDSVLIGDLLAATQQIRDLVADASGAAATKFSRSDSGTPVISESLQFRGGVCVNYSPTILYLQIHGVSPEPAAGVLPNYPPIPIAQNQVLILDESLLGRDGFGYNACTLRVSTSPTTYAATAATAGLWALIARFK